MRKLFYLLVVAAVLLSCSQGKKGSSIDSQQQPDSVFVPKYAKQFCIKYYKNYKVLEVNHPWDSTAPKQQIVLTSSADFQKKHTDAIMVPVKKWVAVSSTQISYASEINGALDALVAMAEPQYVSNEKVVEGLKTGKVKNLGSAFAPDIEVLIDQEPDMMMIAPFKEDFYQPVRDAGIKLATNSSYLENTPLGRAEWLVYVAAFFNKEKDAMASIDSIAKRYLRVKALANSVENKPTMFSGKIYQGVWYVAAAQSYNANFYNDAGADYVFADRDGRGSLSYDFETVYDKASDADYWVLLVNYKGEFSYEALKTEDVRYADFDSFKNKKVVASNTALNRFYEEGLLCPDIVLSDLVKVFHPDLLPEYEPVYYKIVTKN